MNSFVAAEYETKAAAFAGMVGVMSTMSGVVVGNWYVAFLPLMMVIEVL